MNRNNKYFLFYRLENETFGCAEIFTAKARAFKSGFNRLRANGGAFFILDKHGICIKDCSK